MEENKNSDMRVRELIEREKEIRDKRGKREKAFSFKSEK